jgi:hypothetical protein
MKKPRVSIGCLVVGVAITTGHAWAADLTNNVNLSGGAALPLSGGQSVTRNASGVWDFGDMNGNGDRVDPVTPAGLDVKAYQIKTADGTSISWADRIGSGTLTA